MVDTTPAPVPHTPRSRTYPRPPASVNVPKAQARLREMQILGSLSL